MFSHVHCVKLVSDLHFYFLMVQDVQHFLKPHTYQWYQCIVLCASCYSVCLLAMHWRSITTTKWFICGFWKFLFAVSLRKNKHKRELIQKGARIMFSKKTLLLFCAVENEFAAIDGNYYWPDIDSNTFWCQTRKHCFTPNLIIHPLFRRKNHIFSTFDSADENAEFTKQLFLQIFVVFLCVCSPFQTLCHAMFQLWRIFISTAKWLHQQIKWGWSVIIL